MPPLKTPHRLLRTSYFGIVSLACIALPASAHSSASNCADFAFNSLQQQFNQSYTEAPLQAVSFALQAGLLQPQLEQLLAQQFAIEMVDWQVSPHFRWPTDYRLHAPSWNELLERLLKPYQLAITLYPNNSATVRYQTTLRSGL